MVFMLIREFLQGSVINEICENGRFADIDIISEYIQLSVPLLRRWTNPTPITPQSLVDDGWEKSRKKRTDDGWEFYKHVGLWRWTCKGDPGQVPIVSHDGQPPAVGMPVNTIGQLDMIVSAIAGFSWVRPSASRELAAMIAHDRRVAQARKKGLVARAKKKGPG